MDIVITMAGLGSRFKQVGYCVPKYMIEVLGKTLFEWSLSSLSGFSGLNDYYFIVRKEDNASKFIQNKCQKLGLKQYVIVELEQLTAGQAESVMMATPYWNPDKPLLIYNIDTFVEPNIMTIDEIHGDGFIPCFYGDGDHWSFVKLNETGKAIEVREKQRISNNCTVGAYYFKSCNLYAKLYNEYYIHSNYLEMGEQYVAPLYNCLIKSGGDVYISIIPSENVHVLGTPDEVSEFTRKYIKRDIE